MLAQHTGALRWQSLYAMEREEEQADPLPLMAQQDVSVGPCIAPYLATDSSVVVQVAATCAKLFGIHRCLHRSAPACMAKNKVPWSHSLACHTLSLKKSELKPDQHHSWHHCTAGDTGAWSWTRKFAAPRLAH